MKFWVFIGLSGLLLTSCATRIEKPYLKETTTTTDGKTTVREFSAEYINGAGEWKNVHVSAPLAK